MKRIRRFIRIQFGRCPYCGKKMVEGMGGTSHIFLSGMKMCPERHYAEELHFTGATLVYDNGGDPLKIQVYEV